MNTTDDQMLGYALSVCSHTTVKLQGPAHSQCVIDTYFLSESSK